jgi:hypothetical protein
LKIAEDDGFKRHLDSQCREYREINMEARELLNKNGYDEKGIGAMEKLRTYLMIDMQTLVDKTSSHITEMMIIGSNMGVIKAIKNIRKYENEAEDDIVKLMKRLLKFEEDNIKQLQEFLA